MSTAISPPENDLKHALIALRAQNPTLGISKLHVLLLSTYPSWTVSEKRTRKVLQSEGLVLNHTAAAKNANAVAEDGVMLYPSSSMIKGLDVSKYSPKVAVKDFGRNKGKGLIATAKIAEGEVVWKEDPFVLAPEWELFDLQKSSVACGYCSTPLRDSDTALYCRAASGGCTAKFCNRMCLSRSAQTHPLLCRSQNPASVPLIAFARKSRWMGLHALAQCTARLLLSYQDSQDEASFNFHREVYRGLAQLSLEERARGEWMRGVEPDRETWKKAHQLYLAAFRSPPSPQDAKKLARTIKRPIPEDLATELFEYDSFLRGLGRMSLNLEAHGGLYVLHSHMNHSCAPTISARHMEQRTALSRVSAIARRDIEPGEELTITYVNPEYDVAQRRRELLEWGFGTCQCERCLAEEQDAKGEDSSGKDAGALGVDLEKELKAGLGVK